MIAYRRGNDLDLDAVIDLYRASTLGERRPIDDRDRMREMLAHANLQRIFRTWLCACRISAAGSARS